MFIMSLALADLTVGVIVMPISSAYAITGNSENYGCSFCNVEMFHCFLFEHLWLGMVGSHAVTSPQINGNLQKRLFVAAGKSTLRNILKSLHNYEQLNYCLIQKSSTGLINLGTCSPPA